VSSILALLSALLFAGNAVCVRLPLRGSTSGASATPVFLAAGLFASARLSRRPSPAARPRTVAEILGDLRGHSGTAERRAVQMLGRLGRSAIPDLIWAAAHHRNAFARAVAVTALGPHGARGRRGVLRALDDPAMPVCLAALMVLEKTWDRGAAQAVIRLLQDPSGGVRVNAAAVLGRRRVRVARRALFLALRDDKEYVRHAARDALAELAST
jgi:HEAT repeat protein